jgi:RNA recognition motif-containing protein
MSDAFAALSVVQSAVVIKGKFSGESRGFGFVEMPNKDEAEKAIAGLNGKGPAAPDRGPFRMRLF